MSTVLEPTSRRFRPASGRDAPGVVLLHDVVGVTPSLLALGARLGERGFHVAVPDLIAGELPPVRALGDVEAALEATDDGLALAAVDGARRELLRDGADPARIVAIGFGLGGTLAMVSGGALVGFAAGIGFYGRVAYPTVSDRKPAQPMDLLYGSRGPLQLHFGDDDPLVPPHHLDTLRARLEPLGIAWQVLTYPGATQGFWDPAHPGYDAAAARAAWSRAERFLDRVRAAPVAK